MTRNRASGVVNSEERRLQGEVLNERDALRLLSREVDRPSLSTVPSAGDADRTGY